jgi:hypothetical protein
VAQGGEHPCRCQDPRLLRTGLETKADEIALVH